jgi:hypothetical protein
MQSTRYSYQILMELEFSLLVFEEYSNIKFYVNPSSGSRVVPWVQADRHTDMTKLIIAFYSFVKAPKMVAIILKQRHT